MQIKAEKKKDLFTSKSQFILFFLYHLVFVTLGMHEFVLK